MIFNGAEAVLYLDYWFNYKIIKKIRKPKDYRQNNQKDQRTRPKEML